MRAVKARRIRKQALAIKQEHPSDPRTVSQIARAIRRRGTAFSSGRTEKRRSWRDTVSLKMSVPKKKR